MRLAVCLTLAFSSVEAFARAEFSAPSKAVIEQARRLSTEGSEDSGRKELAKFPREQLLSGLRDGLKAGAPWAEFAASAAVAMKVTELVPDLRAALKAGGDWTLVYALGELVDVKDRETVSAELLKSVMKSSDATVVAVLQTLTLWKLKLDSAEFESFLMFQSYEVRQAAVRNFLATREMLDVPTQVARFQLSFSVKPFEVRSEALSAFAKLSAADRKKLSAAVTDRLKNQCKSEKEVSVKAACKRAVASENEKVK